MAITQERPPKAAAPLLSLDTLAERHTILIDGQSYGIKNVKELSAVEYHLFGLKMPRLSALVSKGEDISADEAREVSNILAYLCRVIVVAPPEVHSRLSELQRLQIIDLFPKLSPQMRNPKAAGASRAEASQIGAKSSRGYRRATAATR
jgi:hypothetical protein